MTTSSEAPLITCVMIFLNGEKYIAEAIDSIRTQTYRNWELVLVDDGSTDGASAIARDYAARFPAQIRYTEHEGHANRGMSASRNAGVAAGCGSYISFLDADDIWLPERLEKFVAYARDFPQAGMIYGPTLYWYSWAEARGERPPVEGQPDFAGYTGLPEHQLLPAPTVLREFLVTHGGVLPGICSLLIRRDAYERIGGFEEAFRGLYEDQVFLSKMTATEPVAVINEVLDYYRQHSESCCWRSIESGEYDPMDFHPARGVYLKWLRRFVQERGIGDPAIHQAVREQLRPYTVPFYQPAARFKRKIRTRLRAVYRRIVPKQVRLQVRRTDAVKRYEARQDAL